MAFKERNKYRMYVTTIIAIVAIVGMVYMFTEQKAGYVVKDSGTQKFVTAKDNNLAGETYTTRYETGLTELENVQFPIIKTAVFKNNGFQLENFLLYNQD